MIGNNKTLIEFLSKQDENSLFELTKKQEKSLRSLAQNRFYFWYVVQIISDFHWMTPIETHFAIKATFNIETTTDLSNSEFKTLIEMIQDLWENKFNVKIPNPRDIKEEESLFNTL